jgi:hypothetical protein
VGDVVYSTGYYCWLCLQTRRWSSKKQPTVALSTAEAEYMALTHATKEAIWLRTLLSDLEFPQTSATLINADNQGSIALVKNPVNHARTKHIDIHFHFTPEQIESNEIQVEYGRTGDMGVLLLLYPFLYMT